MAAVNYLNTLPLIYGLHDGEISGQMSLEQDYPANVARKLLNDEADIGLLPVAVIPLLPEPHIISGFCIGASEDVASVCLFSDVPLEDIQEIYLDYQSRTSVELLKILLKEHWKKDIQLIASAPGFENQIKGTSAGLVIGDRAFAARKKHLYIYDLAGAWQQMTKLPFVFAAWVANKKLPDDFLVLFDKATGEGLYHIDSIVSAQAYTEYDLKHYYSRNIDYRFDERKKQGLALFLEKLAFKK